MTKILFVCTGNICRSPLAEALARHKIIGAGLDGQVSVDSAGTHGYHIGERPDSRTLRVAEYYQVPTDGIKARQVQKADFDEFDLILGMDHGHVRLLKQAAPQVAQSKIHLFLDYCGMGALDVADPYYGDFSGFESMYRVIDQALSDPRDLFLKRRA